ncbi:MAG: ATP-dependent DNA helicase RecQ [Thermoguttaceae bacterium]
MSDSTVPMLESLLPRFGLTTFRHGQKEVISTVLAGDDCLCVMPTGGGKSLCYQLPSLALDGLTLVVSPLIALMKDQVDQLQSRGLPVTFINSTLSAAEQYARLDRVAAGEFRLVYVAPERFRSGRFLEAVRSTGVRLLAVDEAHCISEWGHDFRPDYARLGYFRRQLNRPPTLALTATATDQVRRDIVEQLDLREPRTFITGFARPNLFYEVQSPSSERQKPDLLVQFLRQTPGCGIIYASTRKRVEEVAGWVQERLRRRLVVYHAGLLPDQRRDAQERFMDGRCEIIVATNAFGMGIDKPDVRFVVHYNVPGSLEAYYQEAGRAGRDGERSQCLMLYHPSDRRIQEFFIENAYPGRDKVQAVHEFLCKCEENPIERTQEEVKAELGLAIGSDGVGNCEQLLENAGVLERLVASQNAASVRIDSDLPTLFDLLPKQAKMQRKVLQSVERLVGGRRQTLIPFGLQQLSVADELDQASILRALHELNRLESITYVPPFRGRAIRMIDRTTPFDRLEIDFEVLERRKNLEYEKLNQVIRFALDSECRQRAILRYFGESNATDCGHCDNCRLTSRLGRPTESKASEPEQAAANDAKLIEAARIVLSGVARVEARFPCGKNLIAKMLCGSRDSKLVKLRFDQLSTFGRLRHLTRPEVLLLIDALLAVGCLEQTDLEQFRPVVRLTDFGAEVMRGQTPLTDRLPAPKSLLWKLQGNAVEQDRDVAESTPPRSEVNPDVLEQLKQWRARVADEAGVPRFHIMSNATLDELASQRPQTREQLLTVKGIGPVRVERFGKDLLAITSTSENDAGGSGPDRSQTKNDAEATDVFSQSSDYWTRRLLAAGFTLDECVAIRGLPREVLLGHVANGAGEPPPRFRPGRQTPKHSI